MKHLAPRRVPALLAVTLLLLLTACGQSSPKNAAGGQGAHGTGRLTVLAAASLTGTFTTLARTFEQQHPGVKVDLAFDSSATLADQVNQGAPADVLATADQRTMKLVTDQGNTAGSPRTFATNRLVLVVPADNPAGLSSLRDLQRSSVKYVVCVDSAPCGALATTVLADAHITAPPASQEVDVKAVLNKVALGEADAGLVYRTDAAAAGAKVRSFAVPAGPDAVTTYPIAALADARSPRLAADWVRLVTSSQGRQVLHDAGFGPP